MKTFTINVPTKKRGDKKQSYAVVRLDDSSR